jgi:spore coat protein U-like protein
MRKIAIAAALLAAAVSQPAFAAGSKTANMDVLLNVQNSCVLTTPAALDFGTQTVLTGATATGTASVNCTVGAAYTLSISMGDNVSAGSRRMADTAKANFVPYYINTNGVAGDATGTGTGVSVPYSLTAVLNPSGSVPQGDYKDTVVVSLTY